MQIDNGMKCNCHDLKLGALTAMLALVAVFAPAGAVAAIAPHVVGPQPVTAHAVTPSPSAPSTAPSPNPAPSHSAPSAQGPSTTPTLPPSPGSGNTGSSDAVPEKELPGADVPAWPSDAPYPEGLPNHWEAECDLDCKQEWWAFYEARSIAVLLESQAPMIDPAKRAEWAEAANSLQDEQEAIGDEIRAIGGTPGEDPGASSGGGLGEPGAAPGSFGSDAGSQVAGSVVQGAPDSSQLIPDAISGASPIISNVLLGTWDGTWITEALGAGVIEAVTNALWNADAGPCPKGNHQRADRQVTDPNGGSRCH